MDRDSTIQARVAVLGAVAVLMSGCEHYYVRPDTPEPVFSKDDYECARENDRWSQGESEVQVNLNVNSRSQQRRGPQAEIDKDLFRMCMKARGYRFVTLRFESPPSSDYHHSDIDH